MRQGCAATKTRWDLLRALTGLRKGGNQSSRRWLPVVDLCRGANLFGSGKAEEWIIGWIEGVPHDLYPAQLFYKDGLE
jgi:hypothetical protein